MICIAPNVVWDRDEKMYANMDLINRSTTLFSILVMQHEFIFNVFPPFFAFFL